MSKRKANSNFLANVIALGFAVVALILAFVLVGATKTVTAEFLGAQSTTIKNVGLSGLIFGGVKEVTTINNGDPTEVAYQGGMSTFGLISFIVAVVGIVALVLALLGKNKTITLAGSGAIALSGILMLLVLTGGSDIVASADLGILGEVSASTTFVEFFEGYTLAAGPIVYAVLTILGGAAGAVLSLKK